MEGAGGCGGRMAPSPKPFFQPHLAHKVARVGRREAAVEDAVALRRVHEAALGADGTGRYSLHCGGDPGCVARVVQP